MPLYAATIFVSAFLLFQVQPIIARIILPWFGGSAAVWTICLLFFQVALLLGYLYAHWVIRCLRPNGQALLHVALLAVSVLALPIVPHESWKPQGTENPTFRILMLLLITIGLPYFLLSTTGPLLQAWYAQSARRKGDADANSDAEADAQAGAEERDGSNSKRQAFPYRLYALSNAGSMLALLGYPVVVEPYFTIRQQALGWSLGYGVFLLLCAAVALRMRVLARNSGGLAQDTAAQDGPKPGWGLHVYWLALAACASTLLMAVTNHLSQNVAAIPFLWVLPLSLYLLSFILCFAGQGWRWGTVLLPFAVLAIGAMAYVLSKDLDVLKLQVLIPVFACGLFVCCVLCHGELARSKPEPRYLTSFYLMISIGGAVGGLFVGLLAPRVFPGYYELPIAIAGCAVVALSVPLYQKALRQRYPLCLAMGALTLGLVWYLAAGVRETNSRYRLTARNFYGVLRVGDWGDPGSDEARRSLTHGTILHGEQFLKPQRHMRPTTYYGPNTGVGLAVREGQKHGPQRVGTIGLGTGTMAAYGRRGDEYRFYDINPLVVHLAKTEFSFVRDSKARVDVVLGDARLSLEREPKQNFDVLVVDAFSGDAIPVHLLTREAFDLYWRHLKPGGVLAVHVSNRYLDLEPVVQAAARSLGKEAMTVSNADDEANDISAATWVLVTARHSFFTDPLLKGVCEPVEARKNFRMWTDDYSNLFQILK